MTMPSSMDYLVNNGVLNFEPQAYLNNSKAKALPYEAPMLGGVQMQGQPAKDGFVSKAKAALNNNTFKKVATAVIVGGLAIFGISKCKNMLNAIKGNQTVQSGGNFITKIKDSVVNCFKGFKK